MAIVLTGTKTVTVDVTPNLTAAKLTTLMATAQELMTVGQHRQITDALKHVSGGNVESNVIGTLFP
jgi:hypothetical protein